MGPNKGTQDSPAQKQALRPVLGDAGGRPKGNALFNITAHLGLGGAGASRTSPPRTRALVGSRQANLARHSYQLKKLTACIPCFCQSSTMVCCICIGAWVTTQSACCEVSLQ